MEDVALQKRVELVLERLDRLPSPGVVAIRLFQATASSETALSDVVSILRQDPAMASRVLSLCRRCHRGLAEEVDSLERAVVLLGFQEIRTATLAIEISGIFESAGAEAQMEPLRRHALLVASLSRLIVDRGMDHPPLDPAAAYLAGLLHNLGHLALASAIPAPFGKLVESASLSEHDLDETLQRVIGVDGPLVGGRLASSWGLPRDIRRLLTRKERTETEFGKGLGYVVGLAEDLLRRSGFAPWRSRCSPTSVLDRLREIGLSESDADELTGLAVEAAAEDAVIMGLAHQPSNQILLRTLANANAELERLVHEPTVDPRTTSREMLDLLSEVTPNRGVGAMLVTIRRCLAARKPKLEVRIAWHGDDGWIGVDVDGAHRDLGRRPEGWIPSAIERAKGPDSTRLLIDCEDRDLVDPREMRVLENLLEAAAAHATRTKVDDRIDSAVRRDERRWDVTIQREADHRVAEVTAGAAHEINDPLSVIVGRSQILKGWSGDPSVTSAASEIFEAAQRIAGVVAGLHRHVTAFRIAPREISSGDLLGRCAEEAQRVLVDLGPVEIEDRTGDRSVHLDVRRIVDVVVETCRNALEAQEDAQIRLRASSDAVNDRWILQVEDNGPGFGRMALEHAFDPFFSLKPAGRKAGMGLAVARRVMEAHGGDAFVRNHAQGGGSVVFSFPLVGECAAPRDAA